METMFVTDKQVTYDGTQLRSRWSYDEYGLDDDNLVAFLGPAHVRNEDLVDLDDRDAGSFIRAKSMLHFIGEFFDMDLMTGVLLQRLLICIIKESIEDSGDAGKNRLRIAREGDDLYLRSLKEGKLTVSIATCSPASVMLHAAVNVDPEGAPVKASGLMELNIDPVHLGEIVLERFKKESADIQKACHKVRPIE
jgi:hypothetical protein